MIEISDEILIDEIERKIKTKIKEQSCKEYYGSKDIFLKDLKKKYKCNKGSWEFLYNLLDDKLKKLKQEQKDNNIEELLNIKNDLNKLESFGPSLSQAGYNNLLKMNDTHCEIIKLIRLVSDRKQPDSRYILTGC